MATTSLISYISQVLYPKGSVFISVDPTITTTTLANFYGGTWTKLDTSVGCMVAASGSSFTLGGTAGTDAGQVISHTHSISSGGAHTHTAKTKTDGGYNASGDAVWINGTTVYTGIFYSSGAHSHGNSGGPTTGDSSFPVRSSASGLNVPPYITVNYFWRTA